jgi:hypothetical protein
MNKKLSTSHLDTLESEAIYIFREAAAKVGGILANNEYRANFSFQNLAIQNNVYKPVLRQK